MMKEEYGWKNPLIRRLTKDAKTDDPIVEIKKITRNLVSKAYDQGWVGPPFNPFELAELLDIEVYPNEAVYDARISSNEYDQLQIEYNPNQRPSRINFTIAHEIGHALLPDRRDSIRNREKDVLDSSQWELEFLCNIIASEVLLPYRFFAPDANAIPLDIDHLLELSDKYFASLEAVLLRFVEVLEKPAAIMIASFSGSVNDPLIVDYFKPSKDFEFFIQRGYAIPNYSKAYECINSGWTSKSVEKWEVFNNENHHIQAIGLSPLPKHKTHRIGIFIVPVDLKSYKKSQINYLLGDATKPRGEGIKIIAQVVNSRAGLGYGFGRAMAKAWPKSSKALRNWKKSSSSFNLGSSQLVTLKEDIYVFQMLAQQGFKPVRGQIPLKYESLRACLENLAYEAQELNATVHAPRIGAGEAMGEWEIIEGLIYEELINNGIEVFIYDLPGTNRQKGKKEKFQLSFFD